MELEPFVDFAGRTVLVTGASSGIGRAIARQLAGLGARLIITGRDENRLSATAEALGHSLLGCLQFDLSRTEQILPEITGVISRHGPIYGFCHSAGLIETRPINLISSAGLAAMMTVNLSAGIEIARVLLRRGNMPDDGASMLFVASIAARIAAPGQIAYSASKGALVSAARSLAVEVARRRIRVNSISPGFVQSHMSDVATQNLSDLQRQAIADLHPLGIGRPEDVARGAAFLLAPQNSWITGSDLVVDGGFCAR